MCGISGIISDSTKASLEVSVEKMLKVIHHRGPDSSGVWATDGFAFGMRRLSIIDLEGGNQPIWNNEGVGIVFNGEIYNFKDLRGNLESEGVVFHTQSDTEVILHLYAKYGIECLKYLEGMFSICLYDPRVDKVYLIRDRLGIKPLYYSLNDDLIFSSEIKSILEVKHIRPSINNQAVADYLSLRYLPGPESIWSGINKLEPGTYLEYSLKDRKHIIVTYWEFDFISKRPEKHRNYVKEFEEHFLQAVNKRLLASDVPVGILLSGGLDSSCVAAAAAELGHKNFHTFSIGFEGGDEFNELKYAREVSEHIGSIHHEIVISRDEFIGFLKEFVWYSDEPLADLASIPLYYLCKLAAKHVKVVLSGEGSDEIFAGYNLDKLAERLSLLKLASNLPEWILSILPFKSTQEIHLSGYSNFLKTAKPYITKVFDDEEKKKLCLFNFEIPISDKLDQLYNLSVSKEPLDQLQKAYCHSWLVEDLLMKADKMSMAASLELRVPFLDHSLVEWAASLPLSWKVGSFFTGFTTKRILREFAKTRIPKSIINRPKQGFPVPAYRWIQNELKTWSKESLFNGELNKWISKEAVENIYKDLESGDLQASHKIWNLVILSVWLERWKQS